MNLLLVLLAGYLIGGLPTGILFCRAIKGVDPRSIGSGSSGATNVSRVLGKKWALVVLFIDALKGYLPVKFLAPLLSPEHFALASVLMTIGVIAGHVWTPYASFRGGKGVATAAGALLALQPLAVVIALAVWLARFPSPALRESGFAFRLARARACHVAAARASAGIPSDRARYRRLHFLHAPREHPPPPPA